MATLFKELKGAEYVERGEWPLVRVNTRKARQLENLKVRLKIVLFNGFLKMSFLLHQS